MKLEQPVKTFTPEIPRLAVLTGLGYNIGATLFDNFYQFLAIILGSTGIVQGLLTSVRQLGSALLNPLYGYLSDRFGRKPFLLAGNIILAIIALIIPFSPNAEVVLLLVVVQSLFGVILFFPSWIGYLGDYTESVTRGTRIGQFSSVIGWISNIFFLAIAIIMDFQDPTRNSLETLRIPFLIGAIAFVLSAIVTLFLPTSQSKQKKTFFSFNIRELDLPKAFTKFIIVDAIFTLVWGAAWPLFPYVTFGVSKNWLEIGLLIVTVGIAWSLSQRVGGKICDKVGRRKVIIWSRAVVVIPPILFYLAVVTGQIYWIFISNLLVGLLLGGSMIAVQTLILDIAPEEKKATFLSIQGMISGLSAFIGSTITGVVLQFLTGNTQPSLALVGTLLLIIAVLRFIFWFVHFRIEDTLPIPLDLSALSAKKV
ncbi:MAG: MFS transporter [Promethearchaeota archaeon]